MTLSNKGIKKTAWMRMLVCAFAVPKTCEDRVSRIEAHLNDQYWSRVFNLTPQSLPKPVTVRSVQTNIFMLICFSL